MGLVIGGGDRRVEKEEIWARFKSGEREVFGEGRLRRVGVKQANRISYSCCLSLGALLGFRNIIGGGGFLGREMGSLSL